MKQLLLYAKIIVIIIIHGVHVPNIRSTSSTYSKILHY